LLLLLLLIKPNNMYLVSINFGYENKTSPTKT